jgi:hypothetical protein
METEQSSEVTEEQELTQEAIDAAAEKETPAEVEPTVPLHVHTALRTRAQEAEVAAARAEGALDALKSHNIATATVSPLQAAKAAYIAENGDAEGFTMSVELYEQDTAYKDAQAAKAADVNANQQLEVLQSASLNTAKLVHDDYEDVIIAGRALMTPGEKLDVNSAGDNFGELAYKTCKAAIERNKPVEKVTEAAPETESSKLEAEKKAAAEKEELATQEELLKNKVRHPDPAVEAAKQL